MLAQHDQVSIDAEEDEKVRYEEDAHKLRTELALEKPSQKVIKKLMKKTYKKRRVWILEKDAPTISMVIEAFPCLKKSKYVSQGLGMGAKTHGYTVLRYY